MGHRRKIKTISIRRQPGFSCFCRVLICFSILQVPLPEAARFSVKQEYRGVIIMEIDFICYYIDPFQASENLLAVCNRKYFQVLLSAVYPGLTATMAVALLNTCYISPFLACHRAYPYGRGLLRGHVRGFNPGDSALYSGYACRGRDRYLTGILSPSRVMEGLALKGICCREFYRRYVSRPYCFCLLRSPLRLSHSGSDLQSIFS